MVMDSGGYVLYIITCELDFRGNQTQTSSFLLFLSTLALLILPEPINDWASKRDLSTRTRQSLIFLAPRFRYPH